MADTRLEHIFTVSDRDRDGCLGKAEFTQLVRVVNPEAALNEEQLGLIQEEVWSAYAAHVDREGLTYDGLKELYCDGHADLGRDYEALIKAHRPAPAAAPRPPAAAPAQQAEHVSGGRLGLAAARRRQPDLADASPAPASPAPAFAAAMRTPGPPAAAEADVFAFLQTPAAAPRAAPPAHAAAPPAPTPPGPAPPVDEFLEGPSVSTCFAVRLPLVRSAAELDARGLRAELLAALRQALPEGSAVRVGALNPTPQGLAVGVVCEVPAALADSDEAQYVRTVLQVDPGQVFTASSFGEVDVLLGRDGVGGSPGGAAAADALAAAALAGGAGRAALGATLLLPGADERLFRRVGAGQLVAAVRELLPPLSTGRITRIAPCAEGVLVTLAASAPAAAAAELERAHRALRRDAGAALGQQGASFRAAETVASRAAPARAALGVTLRLPGQRRAAPGDAAAAGRREAALAESLERHLPEGSCVAVSSVEDTPRGLSITLLAALPAGADEAEAEAAAAAAWRVEAWVPVAVVAAARGIRGKPPECVLVAPAVRTVCGLPSDPAFQFGLGAGRFPDPRPPPPDPSRARSRSVSPAKSPSRLLGRLFSRTSRAGAAAAAAGAGGSPASSAGSPPGSAVIAGYRRRGGSSSGDSAGLVAAVAAAEEMMAECSVRDEALGADALSPAVAAALAAADAVTPGKPYPASGDKGSAPRAVIRMTAFASASPLAHVNPPPPLPAAVAAPRSPAGGRRPPPPAQAPAAQQAAGFTTPTKRRPAPLVIPGDAASAVARRPTPAAAAAARPPSPAPAATAAAAARAARAATPPAAAPPAVDTAGMSPWEARQAQDPRSWRQADASVAALLRQLAAVLQDPRCGTAEVAGIQEAAGELPPWARHHAHMRIGDALSRAQLYPEALHSFRDAAAAHPADPLARFRAANAHFALHQYNDASRAYFDCLQRCPEGANDPLRAKAHVNLGIALESEGRAGAAAREYAKAAALDPAHPRAHKLLGSARCAAGDFHGAVEALTAALEVNPGFADAWGDLGCAYAALGDVGNAERCLGQAVTHDPGHLEARYNMGNLRRQGHDFEGAVACYDAVLAADPSHWRSLLNKAVVQTCSGRGAAAAGNLKAALHLSGAGGVLAAEVDRLQALLRADAGWEEVDQVLAQIDGTAGKVAAGVLTGGDGRALAAAVARGRGEASPGRGPPSVASAARSAKSAKSARSVRSSLSYSPTKNLSPVKSLSPTKSPQRIATWEPLERVAAADFGADVAARMASLGASPAGALAHLDLALLQLLQPCSNIRLDAVWAEAQGADASLAARRGAAAAPGATPSVTFGPGRNGRGTTKVIHAAAAEGVLRRLLAGAPARLAEPALEAMLSQVAPVTAVHAAGAPPDSLDLALLLALAAALADAPARDRLDASYQLLMWRGRAADGSGESPVTRADMVQLLAALKVAFETEHNVGYLAARPPRAADGAYVLYERFCAELAKFFPNYEALPVLCNPLS